MRVRIKRRGDILIELGRKFYCFRWKGGYVLVKFYEFWELEYLY